MMQQVPPRPLMRSCSDLSHVAHKVPAGDTPYVRAKRVQVIFPFVLGFSETIGFDSLVFFPFPSDDFLFVFDWKNKYCKLLLSRKVRFVFSWLLIYQYISLVISRIVFIAGKKNENCQQLQIIDLSLCVSQLKFVQYISSGKKSFREILGLGYHLKFSRISLSLSSESVL